jgi:hypothetical protein
MLSLTRAMAGPEKVDKTHETQETILDDLWCGEN